jgi:hypothetical protein
MSRRPSFGSLLFQSDASDRERRRRRNVKLIGQESVRGAVDDAVLESLAGLAGLRFEAGVPVDAPRFERFRTALWGAELRWQVGRVNDGVREKDAHKAEVRGRLDRLGSALREALEALRACDGLLSVPDAGESARRYLEHELVELTGQPWWHPGTLEDLDALAYRVLVAASEAARKLPPGSKAKYARSRDPGRRP